MALKSRTITVTQQISSCREIEAATGVSHATVSRVANGKDCRVSVAKKLLPFMDKCPCCGREIEEQDNG